MMEIVFLLLLFCHIASSAKHSTNFYLMISSGDPSLPDYVGVADFDEVRMMYYNSNVKILEPRHDWVRKLIQDDPQHWERIAVDGIHYEQLFRVETDSFKQHSNQTGGVHIIQQILGCEWDDETEKVVGYKQYGYNGEDFLTFDLETATWIAANPQAEITKREWDGNTAGNEFWKSFLVDICPVWLKKYLVYCFVLFNYPERPSVSLLQKTPSSPLSCHATGFYPDRAEMLWRKDGEELHEDVEHGEILPNHDGTFQMSVDLNISSVTPEDWGRYECVFHLSGVKEDIITKLDKAVIRTNWGKTGIRNDGEEPCCMTVPIIVSVTLLVVILIISAVGFAVYKKKKAERASSPPVHNSELAERLNPET
ncbi:major histocompatibility complex class I-related gene protein-like [Toxotes jaculatrix]|uniref:major histocompatibility complex class I-related gene protein-like n=1 Tax=Toxotes jaculatrix TaxID=941984 RepID=UPI001B3ACF03|nr:major histocompatibility complex class I-related gene protein-like [Toxotes jaculatrix]